MALAALAAALVLAAAPAASPQAPPPRQIVNVTGGVWRAGAGNLWSLFVVTRDGILLVDPTNPDFAGWLKGELARRFPGVPVRYVVYSHSHWDHIEGGSVFADTARFVAQEGMLRNMDGRYPHFPGGFVDLNRNGTIEVDEVRDRPTHPDYGGVCGSNFFAGHDLDHDGHMTPAEYFSLIRRPDITYSDRLTIVLGGETIELVFPGKNHADDGTVVFLPKERLAYSVDFPADALVRTSMKSLPSACGNYDSHPIAEWLESFHALESLDFDTLVQSHGPGPFTKADVVEARRFLEDLTAAVTAGMAEGRSLEELKRSIRLDRYKDWAFYERLLPDNIEAAYNNLSIYR